MMITRLDASHKCVIANWEAIDRIMACREQVEGYVKAIAKRAYYGMKPTYRDEFAEEDGITNAEKKGVWMQLNPISIGKAKQCGDYFAGIGIENFKVGTILYPTEDNHTRAYVYSVCHANKDRQRKINSAILKAAEIPKGFIIGDLESGYIFEQELPALNFESFEDPKKLEAYFSEPMLLLLKWWKGNENMLLKTLAQFKGA